MTHSHVYIVFFQLQRWSSDFVIFIGTQPSSIKHPGCVCFHEEIKSLAACATDTYDQGKVPKLQRLGQMACRLLKLLISECYQPEPFPFTSLSCSYSAHWCQSYFPKAQFRSSATQAKSHLEHFDSYEVISRDNSIWTGSSRIGRISVGRDLGGGNTGEGKQSEHAGQKELGE